MDELKKEINQILWDFLHSDSLCKNKTQHENVLNHFTKIMFDFFESKKNLKK